MREQDVFMQTLSGNPRNESWIKLVHIPTGFSAECSDSVSRRKNREKAWQQLQQLVDHATALKRVGNG